MDRDTLPFNISPVQDCADILSFSHPAAQGGILKHPYPGFFAIRESGMRESVCPVNMRSQSGQPCALCRTGDFSVLATARHTRVCLRVAVLHKSPRCAAAVRLTAANQAAFGIFECARRRGAAFFSRARSARRLLPRDSRRGGFAWRRRFAFTLRFKASLLAMLASRSRLARTEAAVHRYARSSSLATSPRSTNHSIHTSCPPRRINRLLATSSNKF